MPSLCYYVLLCILAVVCAAPTGLASETSTEVQFNRDIRPLLSENCFVCHGADEHAHEQAVDRLLAPPHYGERMAINWLDIAHYRQDSNAAVELIERDPENRLLGRGPRFRLPAEVIRDQALSLSGDLVHQVGGPSVLPRQPDGLYNGVVLGVFFPGTTWTTDTGDDLYRRSVYTFFKRTSPHPMQSTFDAPDRETCAANRTATNTPLQSLHLLNDPTFVEAARHLAERGVRFIQLYHRGWDHHGNIQGMLPVLARDTDLASAALLTDLKQRGMLDDTLVVGAGEFCRTPYAQGNPTPHAYGRDHHGKSFSFWMAGGGVKAGHVHGKSDDYGFNVIQGGMHVHDIKATVLHMLGIDHERLPTATRAVSTA